MTCGKGVRPVRNGGLQWVNAMSVIDSGAWVGDVQIGIEEERSRWRERESEERDMEKK